MKLKAAFQMHNDELDEDKADSYGCHAHDTGWPGHSGNRGHYCLEWDDLWICEDCEEFKVCSCFTEYKNYETPA